MNDKQNELYRIIDIAVGCCASEYNGRISFTRDDILGKSKREDVCMCRAILVSQLVWAGFSVNTIAGLLNRSPNAIRKILAKHNDYVYSSRAYRIALSEVTIKCKDVEPHGL